MTDPLDTAADILEASTYILDRWLDLEHGRPLALDDQRRVLSIARRALLRIPLPPAPEFDDRPVPAWLLRLTPDQES